MKQEQLKKLAGEKAAKYIDDGMIVGLGSGSTIAYTIKKIGELIQNKELKITGIPTSSKTAKLAKEHSIPLSNLEEHPVIDLTIDGADEVDRNFNLIKGGGGALTREKIVAYNSKQEIIVVDETKIIQRLGSSFPLPIEVVKFGWNPVKQKIEEEHDCKVELRTVMDQPFITDNANYIVDCEFDKIDDPQQLEKELNVIPGVIENGLFIDLTDIVIIGSRDGVRTLKK